MDITDYRVLPPEIQNTLRKYHLISTENKPQPDGTIARQEGYRETELKKAADERGKPLGAGPVLDPEVISRFLGVDTTPNKDWFEWLILQVGGGRTAQKRSEKLLETAKTRFLAERLRGYTDSVKKITYPPVSKQEAEAQWASAEPKFIRTLMCGDQELVDSRSIFGFYRHWPGKGRIYERAALAVQNFLKMQKKILQMNKFLASEGRSDSALSLKSKDYGTIDELEAAMKRVTQFFASQSARKDVRLAPGRNSEKTIYDDDYITVRVPLTYAAAMKYGQDAWPWASRQRFEQGMEGKLSYDDVWRTKTGKESNVFVYFQFNVPMPAWVTMTDLTIKRHTLHNLSLIIPHSELKRFNPDSAKLYDEENNGNITFQEIKQRVRDESNRADYDPEEHEEYPIYRGPSAYDNKAETAEEVVRHLDAALDAVKDWAATFDPKTIVSDYLGSGH